MLEYKFKLYIFILFSWIISIQYLCITQPHAMRTNIDINNELLQVAMEISHATTKKAVVEMALKEYIDMTRRRDLASLFGQVEWEGNLNEMRTDTTLNEWDN